jgi:hypothetical protein
MRKAGREEIGRGDWFAVGDLFEHPSEKRWRPAGCLSYLDGASTLGAANGTLEAW